MDRYRLCKSEFRHVGISARDRTRTRRAFLSSPTGNIRGYLATTIIYSDNQRASRGSPRKFRGKFKEKLIDGKDSTVIVDNKIRPRVLIHGKPAIIEGKDLGWWTDIKISGRAFAKLVVAFFLCFWANYGIAKEEGMGEKAIPLLGPPSVLMECFFFF